MYDDEVMDPHKSYAANAINRLFKWTGRGYEWHPVPHVAIQHERTKDKYLLAVLKPSGSTARIELRKRVIDMSEGELIEAFDAWYEKAGEETRDDGLIYWVENDELAFYTLGLLAHRAGMGFFVEGDANARAYNAGMHDMAAYLPDRVRALPALTCFRFVEMDDCPQRGHYELKELEVSGLPIMLYVGDTEADPTDNRSRPHVAAYIDRDREHDDREEIPLPAPVHGLTYGELIDAVNAWLTADKLEPCRKCGCLHWKPNVGRLSSVLRDEPGFGLKERQLCSQCWWNQLDAERDDELAELAKQDARMKAKGMTHRIDAWIHGGGDDYCLCVYQNREPTKADIAKALRNSSVKNDYSVKVL